MSISVPNGEFFRAVEQCLINGARKSALDRISVRGMCGLEQIATLLPGKVDDDATEIVIHGSSVDWRFALVIRRPSSFSWEDDGTLAEVFENEAVDQVYAAVDNANLVQLLSALLVVLEGVDVEVEVTWRNRFDKVDAHYLETVSLFLDKVTGDEWHVFVRELMSGPPALIIGDLEGGLQCKHFQVFGLGGGAAMVPELKLDVGQHADPRPRLPSPNTFALLDYVGGVESRDQLALALNGVTRALTWYWIASSVEVVKNNVTLHFAGTRVVRIESFRPAITDAVGYDVRLAEWTFSTSDSARLEAVRRAASTVLGDDDSFTNVSAPVLRTAESLYEIARRDVIGEALATRRAARQAVLTAANEAAKSAREASAKMTERSMVQVAASVAILVANAKDLINMPISLLVIGLILGAVFVTWRVSRATDLLAARRTLENFVEDLDEYRDTLSGADVNQLRGLRSISAARQHLDQSERIARRMVVGVAALLVATALSVFWLSTVRAQPEVLPPGPSATTAPSIAPTATVTTPGTSQPPPSNSE